jgi:NAD(P)-dependent dehydrogenase (short-subunit alcohol dehydrogenase family)
VRLADKVCLITGADVDEQAGERVAAEIAGAGGRALAVRTDVTDFSASKGAVLALTRSMQVDYAPYNIRVNALLPGTILPPFVERYLRDAYPDYEQGLANVKARQLTGDLGRPEDVTAAALFLASDESRLAMGAGLIIDGGLTGCR